MGIFWRKKDSSIVYKNPDTILGSSYTLTGLEPNTTYEIKVHVSSEGNSIPISEWMLATTHAKRMYKLNQNENFYVLFLLLLFLDETLFVSLSWFDLRIKNNVSFLSPQPLWSS